MFPTDGDSFNDVLLRDRPRLKRLLRQLHAKPDPRKKEAFRELLERSQQAVARRREQRPQVLFAGDLPILEHRTEIISAIQSHQVVVVSGETGSGKSTQLPKFCLEAGFGVRGLIGHTQPRRIAARSIAGRVAEELGSPVGNEVGFKVRFTDHTRENTFIKLMTDGILLAETQTDRFLDQYEVLIIDEAHERSLNVDFLLGFLSQLLPKRPELRLIVTSATIDAERFSNHFATASGPAPFLEVSGRSYPVETRYQPLREELDGEWQETDEMTGLIDAVVELAAIDRGHILVFLPTERDIREAAHRLRGKTFPGDGARRTEILPLYARLSAAEQNRVFQDQPYRRIVLATNVAESSLTVPGIRYVVDTGTARISRYAPRSKVQRLPIEPISRASADQRAGRCGRVAPGVCIRLYSEEDYLARPDYTTPEIQRTNLASVILRAEALRLGDVATFPFLDPPRPDAIRDGYATLFEVGAVDESHQLTTLGKRLSRFPVDPRIARIILAADDEHCLSEILIIAAALEVQDPRERPHDKQQHADQQHAPFRNEESDFLSYLKMWDFYHEAKERLSRSQLRRFCKEHFLSMNRIREWTETHRQLLRLAHEAGLKCYARSNHGPSIHKALLTGFLSGIGFRSGEKEYTGPGGVKFYLWPGSGLFKKKPSWCLIAELVETSQRFGRTVAQIDPRWIEPVAEHLVRRLYEDPHWHRKSGRVMVWESVTLFGMPIVSKRRVPYSQVDPEAASTIFLREGLAKRQLDCRDKFYQHNEKVIEEATEFAAKTRRAHWVIDEFTLFQFYDERLPSDIFDMVSLRRWLKVSPENRQSIRMSVEELLPDSDTASAAAAFPNEIEMGRLRVPLEYCFAPGDDRDGLTMTVPIEALSQLPSGQLDWLVPGMMEEKVVALIRSLPKSIRRALIPAPEKAKQAAERLQNTSGPFFSEVVKVLSELAGERIPSDAFRLEKIPNHLRMNIRVVGDEGQVLREGRDLSELRNQLEVAAEVEITQAVASADEKEKDWHRDDLQEWDFGDLPASLPLTRGSVTMDAYPAVVDQGESVALRLFGSRELALHETRHGIRRLFAIENRKAIRSQLNWLPEFDQVCLWSASRFTKEQLKSQVRNLLVDRAFFRNREGLPRTHEAFTARQSESVERIGEATVEVATLLPRLFKAYHEVRLALEERSAPKWDYALRDIEAQLASLFADRFLVETPWNWLEQYPRYLSAIPQRLDRIASGGIERDRAATEEIAEYWRVYEQESARLEAEHRYCEHLTHFRWMLEEYRVSCFAQKLGTSITVSAKRLEKQLAKVV